VLRVPAIRVIAFRARTGRRRAGKREADRDEGIARANRVICKSNLVPTHLPTSVDPLAREKKQERETCRDLRSLTNTGDRDREMGRGGAGGLAETASQIIPILCH